MVRHHHEWYDGQGYPDRLRGDQIPIGARILAVADCFDTMVSDRAYKTARPLEAALAELKNCAGTQFDPVIVEAFLESLKLFGDPRLGGAMEEEEVEIAQ
jgi:HD-GYP domain-containing protein (c-di-GMP phosphodiesterase class II)